MCQSLLVLEGGGTLTYEDMTIEMKEGDSIYIPKGGGDYEVQGKLQFLLSEA